LPYGVPEPGPEILAVFDAYPDKFGPKLRTLRRLVFDVASEMPSVGRIEETLKWGQPSYLTPETKSGSTLRIAPVKGSDTCIALYVHCQTDLISTFKDFYGDTFTYEGKRALLLNVDEEFPETALRHCISLALTYHLNKKQRLSA